MVGKRSTGSRRRPDRAPPGGAVAGAAARERAPQGGRDIGFRPARLARQLQRADHRAYLAVQEGTGHRGHPHLAAAARDLEPVERLDRRARLAPARPEGREIVPPDQRSRRAAHGGGVEAPGHVPHPQPVERGRGRTIEETVEVGARNRREARVKRGIDLAGLEHADRLPPEVEVHRLLHRQGRGGAVDVDVDRLAQRVHAGIGAAGSERARRLAAEGGDRPLERLLDRRPVVLALPADIGRTVIFDDELVAGHAVSPWARRERFRHRGGSRVGTRPSTAACGRSAATAADAATRRPQRTVNSPSTTVPGPAAGARSPTVAIATLMRSPLCSNQAPGAGAIARTRRSSSTAGRRQSRRASAGVIFAARVTPAADCSTASRTPSASPSTARTISGAPRAASRSWSSPAVVDGPIATRSHASTGPVSRPSSMRMAQTPASVSPLMIAR